MSLSVFNLHFQRRSDKKLGENQFGGACLQKQPQQPQQQQQQKQQPPQPLQQSLQQSQNQSNASIIRDSLIQTLNLNERSPWGPLPISASQPQSSSASTVTVSSDFRGGGGSSGGGGISTCSFPPPMARGIVKTSDCDHSNVKTDNSLLAGSLNNNNNSQHHNNNNNNKGRNPDAKKNSIVAEQPSFTRSNKSQPLPPNFG